MAETPRGTPVGVADPYAHAGRCDHLTGDGRCRLAAERPEADRAFAAARRDDGLRCPAADPEGAWEWRDCPHFRSRTDAEECARCGLRERRDGHGEGRPLLEEHHLSYRETEAERDDLSHEITVTLCRWCHAKVHGSFARVDDDVNPDAEALAAAEARRSDELAEAAFETAAERRGGGE